MATKGEFYKEKSNQFVIFLCSYASFANKARLNQQGTNNETIQGVTISK
jgi:hypothetical protein